MYTTAILPIAYLAPVQYYTKFLRFQNILLEQYENYPRQTYRNRCTIYGANGLQILSIPVDRASRHKMLTKDVKIDYAEDWQKNHWKSIESAYRSASFYEFYMEDIIPFYRKKYTFLIDYVLAIHNTILNIVEIAPNINLTDIYSKGYGDEVIDYRDTIHPKKEIHDPLFSPVEYFQVFADRYGFKKNLSIIDLLFNAGPETLHILGKSIVSPTSISDN